MGSKLLVLHRFKYLPIFRYSDYISSKFADTDTDSDNYYERNKACIMMEVTVHE